MENGSEIIGVSKPKERARSRAFTELCLMFAGSMSVREGAGALNRVLWRTGTTEIKLRTYFDFCQRQGRQIEDAVARESAKALEEKDPVPEDAVDYASALSEELSSVLGRRVSLSEKNNRGKIELFYDNADDREALVSVLRALRS